MKGHRLAGSRQPFDDGRCANTTPECYALMLVEITQVREYGEKKMWGEMMMVVNITSEWAFVEGCLLIPNGNVYRRASEFKGNVYRRASDYSTIVDKKK